MDLSFITPQLRALRAQFNRVGFDLRLVGGVVRDTIAGIPAKDVDLCTDATPDQQQEIYEANGYRWIPTGLQHGTATVVLADEPHEITSLRVDVSTDGRHAEVEFTSDWIQDLQRRDLTINAMSMTFDGEITDPFGGRYDLADGLIRFVGDPVARIREDYLRILRYFRFHARFGRKGAFVGEHWQAVCENAAGLQQISRERVWSEVKQILKYDRGPNMLGVMDVCDIGRHMDLPECSHGNITYARDRVHAPELLMAAWCGWDEAKVQRLAQAWKWSRAEADHAVWITDKINMGHDLRRLIAMDDAPRAWVAELARLEDRDELSQFVAEHWVFEPFPVTGHDLMQRSIKPGKVMGQLLRQLKEDWAASGYTATKRQLLDRLSKEDQR
jgi:tRNA nucleotidyltransferase (CCA-adding enzyme)